MPISDNDLLGTFDAGIWAEAFVERIKDNPSIARDVGTMIAWFSGAIMAGYDFRDAHDPKTNRELLLELKTRFIAENKGHGAQIARKRIETILELAPEELLDGLGSKS